jgi:hypothetical protein
VIAVWFPAFFLNGAAITGGRNSQQKETNTMATEKEMYELVGRAVTDADFRALLAEDPAKAAAGLGIELTEEQGAALKSADLKGGLENLDERDSKLYSRSSYLLSL